MTNGLLKELQEVEALTLPERDVRAGKPMLGGLLRFDLVRAVIRIATLAALDIAGLLLAIYTALVVKAAIRHPDATITFEGPEAVGIAGWSDGLRLLIDNLLDNAVRHGRPDVRVAVVLTVDDGTARLVVDDDGPGIPAAERQRVFERFVRGSGTRAPGSGLGLALVAQQAAVHGGSARIDASPLGGARVVVDLPVSADGQAADVAEHAAPAARPDSRPRKR